MHPRSGRQLSGTGYPQSRAFPPFAMDLLPGQAWKEVTFSKVCLNRNDMWMCWHEQHSQLRTTTSHSSARKAVVAVFFAPFFLLFFFFSLPPKSRSVPEKTEPLFVLMVVPFLRFILT